MMSALSSAELRDRLYDEPVLASGCKTSPKFLLMKRPTQSFRRISLSAFVSVLTTLRLLSGWYPKIMALVFRGYLETGYFETYNRENVELVDAAEMPIKRVTPTGIVTSDNSYEFDVIIYATGFDAFTGAFDRIDILGLSARLREKWAAGPLTYKGTTVSQFPNFLMLAGPKLQCRTSPGAPNSVWIGSPLFSPTCGSTATSVLMSMLRLKLAGVIT